MRDTDTNIVIDNGSSTCKAGFDREDAPCSVIPSLLGYTQDQTNPSSLYVGEEAQITYDILKLSYPIQEGLITNWDDMENLWQHIFDCELHVNPKDHAVLLTDAPLNPKPNRVKMFEIMFETFQTPAAYVTLSGLLSLYASGNTTGTVFESGGGISYAISITECEVLRDSIKHFNLAGSDMTKYLQNLLIARGYLFKTPSEKEIVKKIKEEVCYVAKDVQEEIISTNFKAFENYTLPDGHDISIGKERVYCPEELFKPSTLLAPYGIHQVIYNSIMEIDNVYHNNLFRNIVLGGGTTMFPGIADRLKKEIEALVNPSIKKIKIIAPYNRKISAWVGGSILASLSTFENTWITQHEYDECGPSIVHSRCE